MAAAPTTSKVALVATVVGAAAMIAYPVVVYFGLTSFQPRMAALILLAIFAPLALLRLRHLDARAVSGVAWVPVLTAGLLVLSAVLDHAGAALVVPVAVNLTLLAVFGATLRGPTPMIERFARLQEADLVGPELAWCRLWTWIWCGFFCLNATVALVLALIAPLTWWAAYNGIIAYVLMGALFAVEFVVRKRRFGGSGRGWLDHMASGGRLRSDVLGGGRG